MFTVGTAGSGRTGRKEGFVFCVNFVFCAFPRKFRSGEGLVLSPCEYEGEYWKEMHLLWTVNTWRRACSVNKDQVSKYLL